MFDKLKLKKKGEYEFIKNPGDILLAVADDRQGSRSLKRRKALPLR